MPKLDDKTLVPLGVAIAFIGGAAGWATKMNIAITDAQAAIIDQKQTDSEYHKMVCELLRSIDQRLSRIEGSRRKVGE
jgi:hypothetical protein